MRGLADKKVIITGGGGGIGRAISLRLAEEGAVVGVLDIDKVSANETVEQLAGLGGNAYAHQVDIIDYDAVESAIAEFEAATGPVDILINNAGWDEARPFIRTDPELWRKIIDINLYGPLNLHHVVVRGMAERGRGKVINIASDAGRVGSSGEAVYAACKGGIIAFTKTLARELARSNVQLNAVCPGPTDTALFASFAGNDEAGQRLVEALKRSIPMRRLGRPDDMPGIVAFLASDEAGYITGQTISVSGGLTMHG
ncbi:MAG: glucose 1-dehydrogenase [Alphaproteobacteria bacterium]|nr:glucose 1-dehydrogenase [Alphaproteobacteria bacterium]